MKKFIAQLNDNSFINIYADEMKLDDGYITVYHSGNLVAFLDVSTVLCAYLSEMVVSKNECS